MDRWISVSERLPTAQDADMGGCVLVWHIYQGMLVMGWHQVDKNRFFSHWMTLPAPPEDWMRLRTGWVDSAGRRTAQ